MVEFVPSNQEFFSREVANINDRSRLMLIAKARIEQERQRNVQIAEEQQRRERQEADLTNTLRSTTARMNHLGITQQANAPKFAAIEQRDGAITAKMEAYLNRERQLSRNPNAGV